MKDLVIFIKRAPLLFVLLPFMVGIYVASSGVSDTYLAAVVLVITGFAVLAFSRMLTPAFNYLWGLLLMCVCMATGYVHYQQYQLSHQMDIDTRHHYAVRAICIESPERTQYGYRCNMRITDMGREKPEPVKPFTVIVYVAKEDSIHALSTGANLLARLRFRAITNRGNPHEFDYKGYQELRNTYYTAWMGKDDWVLLSSHSLPLRRFAEKCRAYFNQCINRALFSEREKAILTAMCLGDKSGMEERTLALFQRMGIAHLFAVSGLHVGFVFLLFQRLFAPVARRSGFLNLLSVAVPVSAIWLFALITGLPESAVRASIMFSVIAIGKLSDQKHYSLNNLALAAFIVLLINPKQLFLIGPQLSFLAVLGILLFYPRIKSWVYTSNYLGRKVWEIVSVSISAQFLIFPFLLFYFHQFSFAFIISNIIATPASALLLYGALLLNIFSFSPFLQHIITYLMKFIFSSFLVLLDTMEHINWLFADDIYLSWLEFILLITLGFAAGILIYRFKTRWVMLFLFLAWLFGVAHLWWDYKRLDQASFVAYNIPGSSTMSVISGVHHVLLTDTVILQHPQKEQYYLGGNYLATNTINTVVPFNINTSFRFRRKDIEAIAQEQRHCWISLRDKKILILQEPVSMTEPYKADVLVIRNYTGDSIKPFLENIQTDIIVFDTTIPFYNMDKWVEECGNHDVQYHHVRLHGAYRLKL